MTQIITVPKEVRPFPSRLSAPFLHPKAGVAPKKKGVSSVIREIVPLARRQGDGARLARSNVGGMSANRSSGNVKAVLNRRTALLSEDSGAEEETRTPTGVSPPPPQDGASANFATSAGLARYPGKEAALRVIMLWPDWGVNECRGRSGNGPAQDSVDFTISLRLPYNELVTKTGAREGRTR